MTKILFVALTVVICEEYSNVCINHVHIVNNKMPKRSREPEEDELEQVAKRVCQLDNTPTCIKRPHAPDENTLNKRQRTSGPTIHHKAIEYRSCIRKLYNMNKRLLGKLDILKHQQEYTEQKYLHLKHEVQMRGIEARLWHPGHSPPVAIPVVM